MEEIRQLTFGNLSTLLLNSVFPVLCYEALLMVYIICSISTAILIHFLSKQIETAMQIGARALFKSDFKVKK